MKIRDLASLGVPVTVAKESGIAAVRAAAEAGLTGEPLQNKLEAVAARPEDHFDDPVFGALASAIESYFGEQQMNHPRETPAPWRQWGTDLEPQSVEQIKNACRLPVSVRGALMPDAHLGYGLPIGGVLATKNAVIPYAVGVDIACRMKMTVLDLPPTLLEEDPDRLKRAISAETRFGIGASFKRKRQHDVMDEDWSISPITQRNKDKAWAQLGSSGSGNHFVEFGVLDVRDPATGINPGRYLALLSHSGSRGTGAAVAAHYSKVAMEQRKSLPHELRRLAWLDLTSGAGQEYWAAMELMGRYAAANHACVHRHIVAHLGTRVLLDVENHHNFAWKEKHDGEEVIVHRKGATPAGEGVLGIIPGSMASPAFIVRGKGNADSLDSASHGAGRLMSRTAAKKKFNWHDTKKLLAERNVELMSAGLDEVPMAYKNIENVMAAQQDLVETLARFDPRLVKMAPAGERPED